MALVEIDRLTIAFDGHEAVSDLSLHIERGDRFGIIGESGSGKSLTALSIAGLLPDAAQVSGSIAFDGAPLPDNERAMSRLRGKRIGMVFQEPMTALNPLMTIGEQIEEAINLAGIPEVMPLALPDLLDGCLHTLTKTTEDACAFFGGKVAPGFQPALFGLFRFEAGDVTQQP